jgi:hypothetical protein
VLLMLSFILPSQPFVQQGQSFVHQDSSLQTPTQCTTCTCCSGLKEVKIQNADGNYLNSFYYDPTTVIISQDLLKV